YQETVQPKQLPMQVIHNGLLSKDFSGVEVHSEASDFLFVGELRKLKGVDLLLEALAAVNACRKAGQPPIRATIVGDGPDAEEFKQLALQLGVERHVQFTGAMPVRDAMVQGQCLILPSRAESLPYIALEAAAAGRPLIATDVGGLSEIVQGSETGLVKPDNAVALGQAMAQFLANRAGAYRKANLLKEIVADRFSVADMTTAIDDFYYTSLGRRPVVRMPDTTGALRTAA
ncbi:MAG: glycosyltransferase family 4 protein, partial [Pseudomonadota bacterium]